MYINYDATRTTTTHSTIHLQVKQTNKAQASSAVDEGRKTAVRIMSTSSRICLSWLVSLLVGSANGFQSLFTTSRRFRHGRLGGIDVDNDVCSDTNANAVTGTALFMSTSSEGSGDATGEPKVKLIQFPADEKDMPFYTLGYVQH